MGDGQKMSKKILFITQDDPFYVRVFFEEFFKAYKPLDEIKGVVITKAIGKKSAYALMKQMWEFYGPLDFLRVGTRYCGEKASGILQDRLNLTGTSGLKQLCRGYGIKAFHEDDVNGRSFLEWAEKLDVDLIISVAASVIFKEDLLALPKNGCLNIHNGKLPKYRGMMPVFWQVYHGETEIGITVHEMNVKIDDGRILLQDGVPVKPGETLDAVMRRMKRVAAQMIIKIVDQMKTGSVEYRENPVAESSYFSFPTRADVKALREKGRRIL
jgi:methionyl-tRNA formyltransferase